MLSHSLPLTLLCILASIMATTTNAADLKSDLREFVALLPRRRIGYIAARHYVLDNQFRHAFNYIRDPAFMENWQQVRATPEFREILKYVTNSGAVYDVTSIIDDVPNRLRAFKIPSKVPVDMMFARNFGTFMKEVVSVLPKARITNLMVRKVKEGGEFAKLYEAMRRDEFKQLINKAKNSPNMAAPIENLSKNSININELIDIGFSVLEWGP